MLINFVCFGRILEFDGEGLWKYIGAAGVPPVTLRFGLYVYNVPDMVRLSEYKVNMKDE